MFRLGEQVTPLRILNSSANEWEKMLENSVHSKTRFGIRDNTNHLACNGPGAGTRRRQRLSQA